MKFLVSIIVLLSSFSASAACLNDKDTQRVTQSFQVLRWNGKTYQNANLKKLCDPKDAAYRLVEAISLIEKIQIESGRRGPTASNSVVAKSGPLNFLKARISQIIIEDTPVPGSSCAFPNVAAYVSGNGVHRTSLCAGIFATFSAFEASNTLIHESRHVEGYPHAFCSHGYFKDIDHASGACDKDYALQGSYGVTTAFKIHVAKFSSDPALRQEARAGAVTDLLERFNKLPLDLKPGIMTLTQGLYFFDGQSKPLAMKMPAASPSEMILTTRNGMPTLFLQEGLALTYAFLPNWINTIGEFAENFRKKLSPSQRQDLLDISYTDQYVDYSCVLFVRELKCANGPQSVQVPLSTIQATSFVKVAFETYEKPKLYLVDKNGDFYSLPTKYDELKNLREVNFKKSIPQVRILGAALSADQKLYVLDTRNRLSLYNKETKKLIPVPQYQNQRVEKIVPFIWSQKLQQL